MTHHRATNWKDAFYIEALFINTCYNTSMFMNGYDEIYSGHRYQTRLLNKGHLQNQILFSHVQILFSSPCSPPFFFLVTLATTAPLLMKGPFKARENPLKSNKPHNCIIRMFWIYLFEYKPIRKMCLCLVWTEQ